MNTTANIASKKAADKEPSVDDLSRQIEVLKADISKLTSTMGDLGKAEAQRAIKLAKSKGREVKATGEDQIENLKVRAELYGEEAGAYVREKPMAALGMAAAFGLLVGMVMTGRR